MKKKIDKFDFIESKDGCLFKDPIKREKGIPQSGRICAKHFTNKGFYLTIKLTLVN